MTARFARTKKALSLLMSLLMTISVFAGLDLGEVKAQALSDGELQNADTAAILTDMGLGWNLGNSLDATGTGLNSETYWGNPKTTQELIDAVKAQGFNTVRVPVSWAKHTTGDNYTIDKQWLARVKEVVDYCYNDNMYVILNIHHDNNSSSNKNGKGYYPSSSSYTNAENFVSNIWSQVADYFKDYDYHLIFETLNEPRLIGTGSEWWFNKRNPGSEVNDAISTINKLNQKAVDVIRASGSNNTNRLIMCPGYDASIDGATVSSYKLPTDISGNKNRIAVAIHAYSPYNFAMNVGSGSTSTYSTSIKNELKSLFDTIKTNFTDKGIPVVMGEFSTTDKNNTAERVKWAKDYTSQAKALNIPCMLWDNNAFAQYKNGKIVLNSEYHGYINRKDNTVSSPAKEVIEALMIPYAKPTLNISVSSSLSLTYGETKKLSATATISGASLSYKSNSDICSVDASGNVTALKAGTGTITITASAEGFDDVTKTVNVTVSKKSISGASVQLSFSSANYTGFAIMPSATLTLGGKILSAETDYTTSVKNNVNAGTATIAFSGIGNYTGSISKTFTIVGTDIAKTVITVAKETYVYSGSAYKPAVTVQYDGKTLTEGTDYSVSYSSNTNAGTAKVTITGKCGFTGTYSESFTIAPKDISGLTAQVAASAEYTGSNITTAVTVKDGTKVLSTSSYTIAYKNNKNIGTATVTITGKGNYTGTITKTFDILPAKQTMQKLETRYKGFFADWAQKGSATGYEVEYSTNANFIGSFVRKLTANKPDTATVSGLTAGKTYYVRVRSYTNVGGKIYYGAWSDKKSIVTAKYDITKATVSGIANKSYTGKAITQSVTVKYSGKTLRNGTDYTVSYSANKAIGTATVTITGKGQYGGVIKKTFKINPAKQEIQKLTAKSKAFFIDWAQKGSATGYEIQYATNSSFKSPAKVTVTNNKTDTKTISKLSANKKYYVRVRSYTTVKGVKYYGAWSAVKSVTTKK